MDTMRIAEIFYSVQGEGALAGVPSVFIRTSGCNLRCEWCDTPYASWQPEGDEWSVDEIVSAVKQHPTRFCVVTGGEPMIAREIKPLLEALHDAGKHLTIETAGTVMPGNVPCDLASLSPKLSNSTPVSGTPVWREKHESTRHRPDVIRAWCKRYDYQLKFVVAHAADIHEIEALIRESELIVPSEKILLMPQARSSEELQRLNPLVVEWCKERGWRYCARLHIDLFGNKRGT